MLAHKLKMRKSSARMEVFMKQLELNNRKVAVIGCGFVGATSAFGLMQSGLFSEMVLIDANTEKAGGDGYFPWNPVCKTDENLCGRL